MDQNKFINTYIEVALSTVFEYVKTNLQLQTQAKVNESVVVEKDQIISALNQQLNENKTAEDWKTKYDAAEKNYTAVLGKLKHMDTLLAQVAEMKNIIAEKNNKIILLNKEIEELKSPKKVINTKITKKKEDDLSISLTVKQDKTLDDF